MYTLFNAIHWNADPVIFEIGSFGLRYYALCFLAAFACSYVLMLKIFIREGKPQELLDQLSIYIFLGTLIGARLGHCLFYEFDYYIKHPLEMILPFRQVNGSWELTGFQGLASHGGAIGILIALLLFSRKTKTDFMWITDRLVIVIPLAGAFVRLGNFFNSEIIGLPAPEGLPWAVVFEKVDMIARHPAQLYEAICYVLIFIILWAMYQKNAKPKPGLLFGIFLILLFGTRFFIEFFKENQEAFEDNMKFNMGQLLSIPFMLGGLFLALRKTKETKK
ncbi:prolipoprotein diacylglyceryl transferase [Sphingobacterium wenxiniae]|uniref:Phosphatidylglycerol--prolipoprotein diacylglyceryl transferase n=1 Tax=Sphingobacterium wenxiniae TaxID=683125 RepID=A0A1I6SXK0_9SPHI|nr:prolipoprotein diacylglyceryl transferase [Sphingobacterium wenxiniae]SFS81612.1 prolipoprotein diacylglyceryl transferase [Sphingobacterium wenxiniae]